MTTSNRKFINIKESSWNYSTSLINFHNFFLKPSMILSHKYVKIKKIFKRLMTQYYSIITDIIANHGVYFFTYTRVVRCENTLY